MIRSSAFNSALPLNAIIGFHSETPSNRARIGHNITADTRTSWTVSLTSIERDHFGNRSA